MKLKNLQSEFKWEGPPCKIYTKEEIVRFCFANYGMSDPVTKATSGNEPIIVNLKRQSITAFRKKLAKTIKRPPKKKKPKPKSTRPQGRPRIYKTKEEKRKEGLIRNALWRKNNPEKTKASSRNYQENNRELINKRARDRRRKKNG